MTNEQIDALTAGQELDRLIFDLCWVIEDYGGDTDNWPKMEAFRPSTDWNDAMLAAEKAGLFHFTTIQGDQDKLWMRPNTQFQAFLTRDCGHWTVKIYRYFAGYATGILNRALEHQSVSTLAEDKSGPVAVCKAILRMKRAG